jgi:hypothetical protein
MTFVYNSAEGAANTTVVSLANSDDNSAGSAIDVVSGNPTYSSTWANHGSLSFKCSATSGNASLIGWDSTVGGSLVTASAAKTFRCYFRFPAAPSATCEVVQVRNGANGGAIQLRTDRKLNIVDDASTIQLTTAAALTVDTTYRLEYRVKKGTGAGDGTIEFKYFLGESTSPIETYSTTSANQGTVDFVGFRWGKLTGIASTETYYFDDVAQDDTEALLGPYAGASSLAFTTTRKVTVDCTGSVGTLTCVQDTGTSVGAIAGPTSDVFTITLPDHKDVLVFTVSADGDGAAVTDTFKVYPDNLSNVLVFTGADASDIADWE